MGIYISYVCMFAIMYEDFGAYFVVRVTLKTIPINQIFSVLSSRT